MTSPDEPIEEIRNGAIIELPRLRPNGSGALNAADAAIYVGCSERKLRDMRKVGEGPKWRKVFNRIWYPMDSLDQYLRLFDVDAA